MKSLLPGLGFKGNLAWVHNEEGSGAKYYNCSVYFPDERRNPRTESGVTIDPGLDLGHANKSLIIDTLNYYKARGILSDSLIKLLLTAYGKRKLAAAEWLNENEKYFKKIFLVNHSDAITIMGAITAPSYWTPLVEEIPELIGIKNFHLAEAVHTSLLSMSYNRGYNKTIDLAKKYIVKNDYEGLAEAISKVKSATTSLRNRRIRESNLITAVLDNEENIRMMFEANLNPEPLPCCLIDRSEFFIMKETQEITKPDHLNY